MKYVFSTNKRRRGLSIKILSLIAGISVSSCDLFIDEEPQPIALLYGVSRYSTFHNEDPRLPPSSPNNPNLISPTADVASLKDVFEASHYKVTTRTDSSATAEILAADIAEIETTVQEGQRIVFYFSGHGFQNTVSEKYRGEWIVLFGFLDPTILKPIPISPYSASDLSMETHFDTDEILDGKRLAGMFSPLIAKGAKLIVIIDACNSGGFVPEGGYTDVLPDNYSTLSAWYSGTKNTLLSQAVNDYIANAGQAAPSSDSVWVMSAAGAEEFSFEEYEEYKHGVFSYFLIHSVELAQSNSEGVASLYEVYRYIYDGIAYKWNPEVKKDPNDKYEDYQFLPHISANYLDVKLFTR